MFTNSECWGNPWNEKYSKLNNCLESVDICDFTVTCHFRKSDYVINNFFRDTYVLGRIL